MCSSTTTTASYITTLMNIPTHTPPRPDPFTTSSSFLFFPKTQSTRFQTGSNSIFRTKATINDHQLIKPSIDEATSFYELLGIQKSGSLVEIKQAYKQLARKYHPDVSPPALVEENTQRFIRVQEAYETLIDPMRRANYDRDLGRGLKLAFSSRRHYHYHEGMEVKDEWTSCWQSQLSELKRRSMYKEESENMSWAARMRRQREKQSQELCL